MLLLRHSRLSTCPPASFLLLAVESRDLFQAENEITACKAEQINNNFHSKRQPRTIFIENSCHFVNLLSLIQLINVIQQPTEEN